MVSIRIYETTSSISEMERIVVEILRLLGEGCTSGYCPHWELMIEFNTDLPN